MIEFLEIAKNWAWIGAGASIFFRWSIFKNKKEKNQTKKTWLSWLLDEINEWITIIFGAFLFWYTGDYFITGLCDLQPFLSEETCNSISVDWEELLFLCGGAIFGMALFGAYKGFMIFRSKWLTKLRTK